MTKRVSAISDELIMAQFEKDEPLSYAELKEMNSGMRQKLLKKVLKTNEEANKEIADTYNFIEIVVDANQDLRYQHEDLKQEWQEVNEEITDNFKKKLHQGPDRKEIDKRFKLFNIVDMDASKACWACSKGLNCLKHGLARKDGTRANNREDKFQY